MFFEAFWPRLPDLFVTILSYLFGLFSEIMKKIINNSNNIEINNNNNNNEATENGCYISELLI